MKPRMILLEDLIECEREAWKRHSDLDIRLFHNNLLAESMEEYLEIRAETPMPHTTGFYEAILTGGDQIDQKAGEEIECFEERLKTSTPARMEVISGLIQEARDHIEGRYIEPMHAKYLRAAQNIQAAETLAQTGSRQHPPPRAFSLEAMNAFLKIYFILKGPSTKKETDMEGSRYHSRYRAVAGM